MTTNYANGVFAAQALTMQCSSDIINAYENYEASLDLQNSARMESDDRDHIINEYNTLLSKAKEMAHFNIEAEALNTELKNQILKLQKNAETLNIINAKQEEEIQNLKEQLHLKNTEFERMQETVFTFTMVNTILSTNSNALNNVLKNWNTHNVYKKDSFINALRSEIKALDREKNQIPTTNSIEAKAYLKINYKAISDKLANLNF